MRKICCLLLLIGLCLTVGKIWYWRTDGFNISRLQGWTQEVQGTWWNEEAQKAIDQDFYYLGRGRQAFAFASEDGRYVLKFPRGDICKLPLWLRTLPLKSKRDYRTIRKAKREVALLESVRLAIDELKESTAMIAMNMSQHESPSLKTQSVRIIDKAGRSFKIPLGNTYFILQHKKELLSDFVQDIALKEGTMGIEKMLDDLFALILERTQKRILNWDGKFLRNYGYDEKRAYQTDVGSFYKEEVGTIQDLYSEVIELNIKPIRHWMEKKHPEWLELLNKKQAQFFPS